MVMAAWRLPQLPQVEVVLVVKSRRLDCGKSLLLHNMNSRLIQHTCMPSWEVVGPGGGLSMLPWPRPNGEMPAETSLAGGNGDAAYSCDWTMAELHHAWLADGGGLGVAWWWCGGGVAVAWRWHGGGVAVAAFALCWILNIVIHICIFGFGLFLFR
jgi:hypothetical protein